MKKHGLLLVDTKYEFGKTADGSIVLVDEVCMNCFNMFWAFHPSYEYHEMITFVLSTDNSASEEPAELSVLDE